MKYVLTWWERFSGSYAEAESAQERVIDVFAQYEIPESLNIIEFVVRVGEYGGYMVVETDTSQRYSQADHNDDRGAGIRLHPGRQITRD